jgi:hypothetical protein
MFGFAIIGVLLASGYAAFRRRDSMVDSHPRIGARTHGLRAPGARESQAPVALEQLRHQIRTLFRRR